MGKILTISNFLSLSRILLIIPILYFLSLKTETGNYNALLFVFLAALTDFLDGYFARKFNQASEFGKIIDPVADKLCAIFVLGYLALYRENPIPRWFLGILLFRDLGILIASIIVLSKKKNIITSNMLGKVTVNIFVLVVIFYILNKPEIGIIFVYIGTIFIVASTISYTKIFLKTLKAEQIVKSVLILFLFGFSLQSFAQEEGEAAKLLKDYQKIMEQKDENAFETYINEELGFTFERNKNWQATRMEVPQINDSTKAFTEIRFFKNIISTASNLSKMAFFSVQNIKSIRQLEDFKELLKAKRTDLFFENSAKISDKIIQINGVQTYKLEYFNNQAEEKLRKIVYVFDLSTRKLEVNFQCPSDYSQQFLPEFEQMLKTFSFELPESENNGESLPLGGLFISRNHKFSLKYPAGWRKNEQFRSDRNLAQFWEFKDAASKISIYFWGEVNKELNLEKITKAKIREEIFFFNGVNFNFATYKKWVGDREISFIEFLLEYNSKIYSIRCEADSRDFELLEATFKAVPKTLILFNSN